MPAVLVVDDDAVDREMVSRCLQSVDGLKILHAGDGGQALKAMAAATPDVVLTDLRMPGMDGLELVGRIRDEYPDVPVLLMTSQGSEQLAVAALKAGAASYVPKRDIKRHLAETVSQVLEVSEARRSRRELLGHLEWCESRIALPNDPALIPSLVAYVQDGLERLGIGDESVRTQVGMALLEAVSNAMVHGNLEVGSELRDDGLSEYYAMISRRRAESPYAARRVRITARESAGRVEYVVEDEGPGFMPASLPDPGAPQSTARVRGRGLFLMRTFMDSVEHNERGNQVTLAKRIGSSPRGPRPEATR